MKFRIAVILILSCNGLYGFSQNTEDSLKKQLPFLGKNRFRVDVLNKLSDEIVNKSADESLAYAKEAYSLSQQINYRKGTGESLNNIGWGYYRKGDYTKSFENSLSALKINEGLNEKKQTIKSLMTIGAVYNQQKNYTSSLIYFEKALETSRQIDDSAGIGRALGNLAYTAFKANLVDKALDYANKAFECNTKTNNKYLLSFTLRTLGDIYKTKSNRAKALKFFFESLKLAKEIKINFLIITNYNRIGEVFKEQKNWPDAISYYEKAITSAQSNGFRGELAESYLSISQVYHSLNNYPKAFNYQTKYLQLHDTLYNEKNSKDIALLQTQFETKAKEAEIRLLKKDRQITADKIKAQQLVSVILIIGLVCIIALVIALVLKNRDKQAANLLLTKQKDELSQQKEAITQQREELLQKTEELHQASALKNKVFSILSHDLRSPIQTLIGTMKLMDEKILSAEEFEFIRSNFIRQLISLNTTLENLLQWSKSQMEGENKPKTGLLNLNDIVQQNINLLWEVAQQKHIQLVNNIGNEIKAMGDEQQIGIVMRNLINNAIKFTHENGNVTIDALIKGNEVKVWVKDTGIGMGPSQMQKLFNLNTHFTSYGTNKEKGTGIGLLLCKDFVEKNNGSIGAESQPGEGSTFYFFLPAP